MSVILEVKDLHKKARLSRDKETTSVFTMLISRADADRIKYGLKTTDELTDEQMIKIVGAEVKQLKQEASYLSDVEALDKINGAINILEGLLPKEMSEELIVALVENLLMGDTPKNMGAMIKDFKVMAADLYPEYSIPMGTVSKVIKNVL